MPLSERSPKRVALGVAFALIVQADWGDAPPMEIWVGDDLVTS